MAYRIVTDSCCDFPAEKYSELGLSYVPLTVRFKDKDFVSYSERWLKDFYDGLRQGLAATTSAVNPQGWEDIMQPVLEAGEDILVMAFSSGLSTTYQSAVIAAQELSGRYPQRTIKVVDTLCASLGQGLLVYYASKKQAEGMSLEELYAWVEDSKLNLCHWFTVDDLMYLKRGGRVSAATAVLGTMLNIKPILHVDDEGHLIKVGTARGRKASMDALAAKAAATALPGQNDIMFISHGDCEEEAEYLAKLLKEKHGVKEVVIGYIGGVIGSHSGPGTMALFFLGSKR
jgi:DegV family protein with EDD domain